MLNREGVLKDIRPHGHSMETSRAATQRDYCLHCCYLPEETILDSSLGVLLHRKSDSTILGLVCHCMDRDKTKRPPREARVSSTGWVEVVVSI